MSTISNEKSKTCQPFPSKYGCKVAKNMPKSYLTTGIIGEMTTDDTVKQNWRKFQIPEKFKMSELTIFHFSEVVDFSSVNSFKLRNSEVLRSKFTEHQMCTWRLKNKFQNWKTWEKTGYTPWRLNHSTQQLLLLKWQTVVIN